MSKFNTVKSSTLVENLAGGKAYKQSIELELISILLTSFGEKSTYRSENNTLIKLKELISKCDPLFIAKAAIYARNEFGMRSITHVVASELANRLSGKDWGKDFYNKIIRRPDDMLEIIAYHLNNNQKISNAMKKGFSKAFGKFDEYSLSKYKGESKSIKLVDVMNLVHPIPNDRNSEALRKLEKGILKSTDEGNETWEALLTQAGSDKDKKRDVWVKLIKENKLKYFALLRNLRNIIEQAPEMIDDACEMLINESNIKKSLVLPFRFLTAFDEMEKLDSPLARKAMKALNKAIDISLNNVPKFEGKTLVVLDVSGSMEMQFMGNKSPHIIGRLFSTVLCKTNDCDFITFADNAKYHNLNTDDSTITIAKSMIFASGGTNFHSIFKTANSKYDRIIILSDMQGWIGYDIPVKSFNEYKDRTNSNPYIYSFDLHSYGDMQFPESKVFTIAGFSDKIFDIMKLMEIDKKALLSKILEVNLKD